MPLGFHLDDLQLTADPRDMWWVNHIKKIIRQKVKHLSCMIKTRKRYEKVELQLNKPDQY